MENNVGFMNNIFRIRKLFTEAYYDYRFSSLFISTLNNMANMVIPNIQKIEYNDEEKYVEIATSSNDESKALGSYVYDVLAGFITFCFEDHIMRDILMSIDLEDFKVFDQTIQAINESTALGLDNRVLNIHVLTINVFNLINFNYNLIRLNLI